MNALQVGLIIATTSGLVAFAFKNPIGYRKLHPHLLWFFALISISAIIYNHTMAFAIKISQDNNADPNLLQKLQEQIVVDDLYILVILGLLSISSLFLLDIHQWNDSKVSK